MLTMAEYNLLIHAYNLRQVDEEYRLHRLAFEIFRAQSRKKNGRPVYANFSKFFNYTRALRDVERQEGKQDDQMDGIRDYVRKGGRL